MLRFHSAFLLRLAGLIAAAAIPLVSACAGEEDAASDGSAVVSADEIQLTILGTNDIHGGLEPRTDAKKVPAGGMAFWAGAVAAIKHGLEKQLGDASRVVLVDAGDQAQGTLLSNFNEGDLIFSVMEKIGYDAMITGNHDYDFGPRDWLVDQVTPASDDKNPRGALEHALSLVKVPLIGANTFLAGSLVDASGAPVAATSNCVPGAGKTVDFSKAKRPNFLQPFVVKDLGGVRVALIGIDNVQTPLTTTPANVADLCFRDEVAAYVDTKKALEGKADVFVAVMHDGDTDKQTDASTVVKNILASGGPDAVQAVIAGHTHFVNNVKIGDVPMIQSGSGGDRFGRIDLVLDRATKKVNPAKTRVHAGVRLLFGSCDSSPDANSTDFCKVEGEKVFYEGEEVTPNPEIAKMISDERAKIAPFAGRKLGDADGDITRDRLVESPLANALTDQALRMSVGRNGAHPDIAMLNMGGVRDNFRAGTITYENLFSVFPFNNHAVVVGPMDGTRLFGILTRSIQSCGAYGSVMQSGLKVRFERDCGRAGTTGIDAQARLLHVETGAGEVLLDVDKGITLDPARTFAVATLDFLAAGGDGFDGLRAASPLDLGVMREALADTMAAAPVHFSAKTDGRWTLVAPAR